jgi:colanic acid/amylovoran biosynthesis glycosyltransferase
MTPNRIGYILNVFPKVSETFIAAELAELGRRGVEVRILSLRDPADELRHEIIERAGLAKRTSYDRPAFAQVLRDFRPQVLHAHFAREATAAARELAAELGVPFTFTVHGYDIYRRPPSDFSERAEAAAALVTVSQTNARYIAVTFGVPAERVHVIPCGVDTECFRPGTARPNPPRIVCVARLAPVKNLGLLLEACAHLRDRDVSFRCVLVGDGPCRGELHDARERLGLEREVWFTGPAEQACVVAWWQQAAVAVLTSHSEGMPVSLMEAAACGVPVVATAVGGVPELVEHGVTGLLTPAGDARALAAAVERLLRDPRLAAGMGAEARRQAERRLSIARQVDQLLALWRAQVHPEAAA